MLAGKDYPLQRCRRLVEVVCAFEETLGRESNSAVVG